VHENPDAALESTVRKFRFFSRVSGVDTSGAPQDGVERSLYVDREGRLRFREGDRRFPVSVAPKP
jgi:hypothetical protein